MVWSDPLERGAPPKKRSRKDSAPESDVKPTKPRLFAPFRALGLVTNHIPFVLQTRRSWALWEGGKMTLLFVGPDCVDSISCLAMSGDAVWAATGPHVIKYMRGKEVERLTNPLGSKLSFILTFGDQIISLTEDGSKMLVWDCQTMELACSIEFDNGFTATSVLHPVTYLNKVLVASSQGTLQLWNIRTKKCIHKFDGSRLRDFADNKSPCAITALTQSPAIDVVAIGFSSGEISLYDIRADERLMRIFMNEGPIQSLCFRSDGESVLASAASSGHIALWDLNNNGRLVHVVRGAHDTAVTAIEWIPGQPVLVSSGADNSVKQWFFETPTAPPRLYKSRSGHHEPPHLIRYYGEDGKQLLSASRDRSLRCTSIVRDSRSFELSQGSLPLLIIKIYDSCLKLPPITQISFSFARSKDWDDVMTAHKQECVARTWTVREKKLGKWVLNLYEAGSATGKKKKASTGAVRAVCVSACGNFGLAGTSTGAVHMYNMQSGIRRKSYALSPRPAEILSRLRTSSEERSVIGLATDSLNRLVIACTYDGTINFFDFHTQALLHTLVLPSTCASILLQRDSGLLAVICDDLVIRLVDIETHRIVREMGGFSGNIMDVAFSPDSRWLIATSLDSVIRTFDIPTGRLIDAFRTASVATSVAFSPTNDFLATAHIDSVGVYLWYLPISSRVTANVSTYVTSTCRANRAQYTAVSLQGVIEEDVTEVSLPSIQGTAEDEGESLIASTSIGFDQRLDLALDALQSLTVEEAPDVYSTPSQLGGDLITLTLLPRSRWQTLLNLEVIQQRNKPKEPPKPPEKAPFFLPTLPGSDHRFAVTQKDKIEGRAKKPSKRLEAGATQAESAFRRKLASDDPEGDFTPAALDLELRALGTSLEGLRTFSGALRRRLRAHRDFEAVQALAGALLRLHGEVFVANPELRESLEALREAQVEESKHVLDVISASLGALNFLFANALRHNLKFWTMLTLWHALKQPIYSISYAQRFLHESCRVQAALSHNEAGPSSSKWTPHSVRTGLIARKRGMAGMWDQHGARFPVTVLQLENCQVTANVKSIRNDKTEYHAVQVAASDRPDRTTTNAMRGHFKRANVPSKYIVKEFPVTSDAHVPVGTTLSVIHFVPGQYVDVVANSIGKGFQGGMKRWGFHGLRASHGVSVSHRKMGATGGHQDPGRVWPGKKMPGRMGGKRITTQNLEVVRVDTELDLIFVRGCVPGIDDAHVMVRDAKKNMVQLASANYAKGRDDSILPKGITDLPFPAGTKDMAALYPPIIAAPSKRVSSPFMPRD
ncbi:hypothetical protein EW145_g1083 [Phellinidium pouzarii]|uniref:Large ribosomal subunit protein uL3m n=1 Tax=Phellinidium pouzarii TaxID=167371 RepID=A0A4S4LFS3_9AGAM|nr:hypothetical protein EW145_g1083 [Phellinidium pouzarii]